MATLKRNQTSPKQTLSPKQLKSLENLYDELELVMWDDLSNSKKHKAYYLFTVLFSEGWWAEDNVEMVKNAVLNHTLNLIWQRRDPDEINDDHINIYFLENEKGKYFIILVHDSVAEAESPKLLEMISVKRNDYEMTRIYPRPAPRKPKKPRLLFTETGHE
jgi:hypothetical protein